jgi:pimeloyl-ACP methyl ester carboxylesterase
MGLAAPVPSLDALAAVLRDALGEGLVELPGAAHMTVHTHPAEVAALLREAGGG